MHMIKKHTLIPPGLALQFPPPTPAPTLVFHTRKGCRNKEGWEGVGTRPSAPPPFLFFKIEDVGRGSPL